MLHNFPMSDFYSLRSLFSDSDKGAKDLTEAEYIALSHAEVEKLIAHVENFKAKSQLRSIYAQAHTKGRK